MAGHVLVTLLLAMVFATCGETRHDQTLKLGLLTYISEGSAQNAQDRQRAFHLAIAHLNQADGVFGRPVEAVVADTEQDPDRAVGEARRLIDGGWTCMQLWAPAPASMRLRWLSVWRLQPGFPSSVRQLAPRA